MKVNPIFFLTNPFFDAYIQSDLLGKLIFIGLIGLSICSWIIMLYKIWITYQAKKQSDYFYQLFNKQKGNPLAFEADIPLEKKKINPFFSLFSVLKKHTVDILNKNRKFGNKANEHQGSYLSPSDIDFVDAHLMSEVSYQTKNLEKNLFILSTVVSLGPFLGLLGTVWGILTTFSEMQSQAAGNTSQMILGGLSLALATTVLGLLDAIPALIGYNYLKNTINDFQTEMEGFSTEILATVEMQYRKVD